MKSRKLTWVQTLVVSVFVLGIYFLSIQYARFLDVDEPEQGVTGQAEPEAQRRPTPDFEDPFEYAGPGEENIAGLPFNFGVLSPNFIDAGAFYALHLGRAAEGDAESMFQLGMVSRFCGTKTPGMTTAEFLEEQLDTYQLLFQQGEIDAETRDAGLWISDMCTPVYDQMGGEEVDWFTAAMRAGSANAELLARRFELRDKRMPSAELNRLLGSAITTRNPYSIMTLTTDLDLPPKRRDTWQLVACHYHLRCDADAMQAQLEDSYYVYDVEDIVADVSRIIGLIESGEIQRVDVVDFGSRAAIE